MKTPFNVKDINFESIKYTPSGNGKSVMLRYLHNNKQNKFFVQTPELVISKIESDDTISTIYFDLKANSSGKVSSFINFLISLDKAIIQNARANKQWFSSNNIKFKGLIRYEDANKPYLKLKVRNSSIYKLRITSDRQSEKCLFSDLKSGMKVKMIVDVNGLWINNNGFGIYLKPFLIDIRETYDLILNDSSEEDIVDTEIVERTETNSVMNLDTDIHNTETNSIVIESEIPTSVNKNDFLSKNMDELLNELSESSENNVEFEFNSLDNDSSNELNSEDNESSNSAEDQSNSVNLQVNN